MTTNQPTTKKAAIKNAAIKKAQTAEQIFAVEVEPGVFVYSLDHRLSPASRKLVDKIVAEGAERTRQAAAELRKVLGARRNGEQPDQ